jgi:hypothetical protein
LPGFLSESSSFFDMLASEGPHPINAPQRSNAEMTVVIFFMNIL